MGRGPGERVSVDRRRRLGRSLVLLVAPVLWLTACHYRLGTPPLGDGLALGAVEAPVAEPGLPEALASALAAAIRRRGAQGSRMVQARVLRAELTPGAARAGDVQAWSAALEVRFELLGPSPRVLVLRRSALVSTEGGGAEGLPASRAEAFALLAGVLAEEAVDSFLYAPPEPSGDQSGVP